MAEPLDGAKKAQPTSSHDWVAEEDRPGGNRRLRSDFEGIWNPSVLSDADRIKRSSLVSDDNEETLEEQLLDRRERDGRESELSWALPSEPNNIIGTSEYGSEDTDDEASGILETRRERYARERQLSWSLPPAYDDLPDRNTISYDNDNIEDQMDMLTEINGNSEAMTKMLKEIANTPNMTDEEVQQGLELIGQNEDDYLGDFPPLPPANQQSEEYTLRPPWNTPKFAKHFLSQQQQIYQRLQPQQGPSGLSDIPHPVTLQQSALQGPTPQMNVMQRTYAQQTGLRAPNSQASGLRGPYVQQTGSPGASNAGDVMPAREVEKEKPQKSFTIEHFKIFLNETGLSLFPAKEFIAQTVATDRLVKLNFAGLDQLTDIFFRILMDHGLAVYLPHLRKFSASGCVHLTDAGVRWLCKISPVLQDITLIGCSKVTSASLSLLLEKEPPLGFIDMSCTAVSTLPLSFGSSSVDLRLDGCPMICPIKKKLNKAYLKEPKSYVADGSDIFEEVQYKVVILKSGKMEFNFGKYLSEGPGNSPPDNQPMTITRGVTIGKFKLNVYDINRVQIMAAQDLVISDGSICLFPFYLESCTPDRLDYLCSFYFRKIAYVLSKSEYVVPVLVGLHTGKMAGKEASSRLMNLKNGVIRRLEECHKPLEERLHIMIKRKWLVHDYDMKGQLYASDAAVMLDKLRATPVFTDIIDTHRKVNPEKFLKDARSYVNSAFSWMMVNCAESQAVMDRLLEEKEPILGFSESEATEKIGNAAEMAGFKTSKMHQPYLKTIARAMNQKGSLLYFPEVDRCPLITNPEWLANVLGILMNPPPPDEKMKRLIRFVSKDQPVWTKQALREALAGMVQEEQLELLLPLLLDYGVLLECAVDRITTSDVPYAYVPLDPLPNGPPINLSDIWAEVRYETVVQRNKHYQFSCGAPLSLYSSFTSQCAKIYKFTLLWKYGFLIRQGVVDVLVGLESNGRDEPVICVSGRTEYQRSEATAVRVNCLWSVMNKITTILDHTIKRYSCFATVVIPCPTCIPTMVNSKIVKDEDVWLYHVILLKAGATRGLKCRSKKYKCSETPLNNTRTVEQLLGPDLSLVPLHMTSQLTSCNDALSDYNRCAMCQGCAIKGRDCPGYGLMGKTVRHCGCEEIPNFPLCPSCGICQRCETYLQALYTSLNPQTIRNVTWKEYKIKDIDKFSKSNVAVALEGKVVQHPEFSWFHTQKDQLYVLDNVNFSPDLFNSIDILYFRGTKPSVGLVRDDHTPIITFNPSEGCIGKDWSSEGVTGQKWKIKNCTLFSLKIRYVPVHAKMKENSEHSGGKPPSMFAVDFYKAAERLWTEYLPAGSMKVALTGSEAGSMIVQTPTLSTGVPLTLDHPDAKEGKLYAEVERQDNPSHLVLSSITPQTENNFIVTTEDGTVQMARDDPKIHPLGYSFASNTDRTLFLLPEHREMSSVPTMFYKRKKKKPLATTSDKAVVTCIEDLSTLIEKKIVLPAPLWFFTEEQRNGWEPNILDMCNCQRFYESTEAQVCAYTRSRPRFVEWVRSAVEERLAYESFASMLLLPAKIDERSLMYPTLPPHSRQDLFQAVYLCSSSAEMLGIHLLNMKGITLPEEQADLTNLFLPFHVFMSLGCQVFLPGYDKMLPEVAAGSLDDNRVQYYLRELLLYITSSLVIFNAGGKVPEVGDLTEDTLKFIYSAVEHSSKENKTTNETSAIAICPAHRESDSIDPSDFDDIPEIRQYLQFVKTAKLEQTVETLPSDFFQQLRGLKEFKVERCNIKELPSNISLCTNLSSLKLNGSKITELPSGLTQLQDKLRELDISHLNLSSLPEVVTKLTKLEILTADCLLLDPLPDTIGGLANLRELSMAGSCLSQLPKSFSNLKKLTKLSLSGVPWPQVKHGQYLTNAGFNDFLTKWNLKEYFKRHQRQHGEDHDILKPFDADDNLTLDPTEMGKLNAKIFNMFPRFGFYGKSKPVAESTGGFPKELLQLVNLTHLDLSYQGIVSVPEDISRLAKLETLLLSDNPYLTSVPGTIGSSPLERLDISDCPSMRTPPREITSKGFFPVMAYLRRLTTGSVKCKRTKLMLVGLGGAGKTSLVKALLSGTNMSHLESGQDITDGIDIHSWTVKGKEDSVTYSVWDFAGQTVYYNTHQFFLSNRAIYLLLWNLRLGAEHAGLDFWLSSISVHAPHAPILVVGSHLDQVQQFNVPTQQLQKRYPQIAGFHSISTLTGMGVADLQEKLFSVTMQEKYMGEDIPEVWFNFEKAVISEREISTNIINYQRVEEIAFASGIFDELETSQAVQFLHDLGTVQHFDNEFLKDQVVINPQWIVDVMASVVSVKDSPIKEGKFRHSDVSQVWNEHPKKLHKWLLRLTEKFDLTFPLAEREMNIVPCLLPETEPEVSWPDIDKASGHKESTMAYRFEYLPVGLFNRGQVRLYEYCDSSIIWKRGSLLNKNGHTALVTQRKDNKLLVKCQGPRPENMLFMIHEVFETLIQESFKGVVYDYKVPCPDCLGMDRDPYMFKASTVRRASGLKTPFLQCSKNFHVLSIADLISACPPTESQDYDLHLKNTVHSLTDIRLDLSVDIFISCCQADLPEQDQDFVDPRKVKTNITDAGYTCWFESATAKDGLEERILALRDAKVFVAMISNNYVNDKDCCILFKFARVVLKKPLVLVTVGPPVAHDWKQSTIGMLVANEGYCNMQREEHNKTKMDELLILLSDKLSEGRGIARIPTCFFSYCWKNSKRAADMGQRSTSRSVGYGDPIDMKDYLEENGVKSSIDIDRAREGGLLQYISESLRDANIMVACVSDEYADSINCQMEFRFATKDLQLPIVLAVVGRSQRWRATELGLHAPNYPQVNFEESADDGMRKLLELVTKQTEKKLGNSQRKTRNKMYEEQTRTAYQELFELAQRRTLRQLTSYTDVYEMQPFPRILVIDFADPEEEERQDQGRDISLTGKEKCISSLESRLDHSFLHRNLCFRFFCEHEQGWHVEGRAIPVPEGICESELVRFSPYLARTIAVIQLSPNIRLNCIGGEEGKKYIKWLDENCDEQGATYKSSFQALRRYAAKTTHGKLSGSLARCLTTTGNVFWLCEDHQKSPHITRMSETAAQHSNKADNASLDCHMLDHLQPLKEWEEQAKLVKAKPSVALVSSPTAPVQSRATPTPKSRTSLMKSSDKPGTSSPSATRAFNPKTKFKAAGYAAQASVKAKNYQKGSKACALL
ncbi:uncharacterized protein LOC135483043 [Lineus longissimus]|uniref:uncharacterized protein LOC135483043 n=1 Tax=Lineus longissimus TaxID=88925 RepID=UPI00315D370F